FISGDSQGWAYPGLLAARTHEAYLAPTLKGAIGTAIPDLAASAHGYNPFAPLPPFTGRLNRSVPVTNLAVPGETLHGALTRLQGSPALIGAYFTPGSGVFDPVLGFHTLFNG